jgi:hypothetical protein
MNEEVEADRRRRNVKTTGVKTLSMLVVGLLPIFAFALWLPLFLAPWAGSARRLAHPCRARESGLEFRAESRLKKGTEVLGTRTKAAIPALALAVLVVEGYLVFRNYNALPSPPEVDVARRDPGTTFEETTSEEETVDTASANAFVHRATSGTIVANSTYLDYQPINGTRMPSSWLRGSKTRVEMSYQTPTP